MVSPSDNNCLIDTSKTFDVVVIGTGIAGLCAALSAYEQDKNANILLVSCGPLFSGSSFAGTTWGLGLVSPGHDQASKKSLEERILEIGQGAADPQMAHAFVENIEDAIEHVESWGISFLQPTEGAQGQREFIPCFDDRHRIWRGIERQAWRDSMRKLLSDSSICIAERWELLDIARPDSDQPLLCEFFDSRKKRFVVVSGKSIVLATGGTATLWPESIAGASDHATVHALASELGIACTGMQYIQFMPTIAEPVSGVVFNEKAFKFMVPNEEGAHLLKEVGGLDTPEEIARMLDIRSGYGPFSSRMPSKAIDFAISAAGRKGMRFIPHLPEQLPEFMATYQDWLLRECGIDETASLTVRLEAQASNGGIAINKDASTSVPGIFACGECTGGMHGADRIGGLSSANALTFGIIAGISAIRYVKSCEASQDASVSPGKAGYILPRWRTHANPQWQQVEDALRVCMGTYCGTQRSPDGLNKAKREILDLSYKLENGYTPAPNHVLRALTRRTELRLKTALLIIEDALASAQA